jgi:hypothetical protein
MLPELEPVLSLSKDPSDPLQFGFMFVKPIAHRLPPIAQYLLIF